LLGVAATAQPTNWTGPVPAMVPELQSAARHFEKFDVVLAPDKDAAE
jgi:hypothetical protein